MPRLPHHLAVPTPSERRALLFVAAVAALGIGARGLRALRASAPPADARAALAAQMAAVDSAVSSGGRRPQPRRLTERQSAAQLPPSRAALVDVDRATETELDALPGIGPALARRIVEDRRVNGPFGGLEALQQVRGIGPALANKIGPLVTFSAPPRPHSGAPGRARISHP